MVAIANLDTALGRFTASTTNEGSWFEAGAIDISTIVDENGDPVGGSETAALAIDAAGLAPGMVVERCIVTTYRGSIEDAEIRAYGRTDGGTGLERYLATTIEAGNGVEPDCSDYTADGSLFSGTLRDLHSRHGSWSSALHLTDAANDGDSVTMRIAIEVVSDDRAQGLDTEFWLVMEARP